MYSYNNHSNYVNGPVSTYMKLGTYNLVQRQLGSVEMPYVPDAPLMGSYMVPDYKPLQYDTLINKDPNAQPGYFNVESGYNKDGLDAANCNTQFHVVSASNIHDDALVINSFNGTGRYAKAGVKEMYRRY